MVPLKRVGALLVPIPTTAQCHVLHLLVLFPNSADTAENKAEMVRISALMEVAKQNPDVKRMVDGIASYLSTTPQIISKFVVIDSD